MHTHTPHPHIRVRTRTCSHTQMHAPYIHAPRHRHTTPNHTHHVHTHMYLHRATYTCAHSIQSVNKDVSTQPGTEVMAVNKTDPISCPHGVYIRNEEKGESEENLSLGLEGKAWHCPGWHSSNCELRRLNPLGTDPAHLLQHSEGALRFSSVPIISLEKMPFI